MMGQEGQAAEEEEESRKQRSPSADRKIEIMHKDSIERQNRYHGLLWSDQKSGNKSA